LAFVEPAKSELGVKALHREIKQLGGACALPGDLASENDALRLENTVLWNENAQAAET
jgi:hypothetical protein